MNHIVTIWRVQVKHRVDQSGVDIIYIYNMLFVHIYRDISSNPKNVVVVVVSKA